MTPMLHQEKTSPHNARVMLLHEDHNNRLMFYLSEVLLCDGRTRSRARDAHARAPVTHARANEEEDGGG